MRLFIRFLLILLIIFGLLIQPKSVSAEFLEVISPAEVFLGESFEIEVKISAQPNRQYRIKARFGQNKSLTKGQTYNPTSEVWLSDTVAWDKFPSLQTNSDGSWSGKVKVKTSTTAFLGQNSLVVRIHDDETGLNQDSPTYLVTLLQTTVLDNKEQTNPQDSGKPILSEFMPQPLDNKEWVELYNDSENPADLSGWKIDDEEGKSSPHIIADKTILGPKAYFIAEFTSFKLNDLTDSVRLLKPDDSIVESFTYTKTVKGQSWAKDKNGNWFITSEPTPAAPNKLTFVSETPQTNNQSQITAFENSPTVLADQTQIKNETLPVLNKSPKIASVSSSFINKKKESFPSPIFLATGSLLIITAVFVFFKNKFKFQKKEKAVLADKSTVA